MTAPIDQTLARIASDLNGRLLAYTPMNDDPDDDRYAIAYRLGRGAWVCAVVDAATGRYLDGVAYHFAPTPATIGVAFATAKGDPLQQSCTYL